MRRRWALGATLALATTGAAFAACSATQNGETFGSGGSGAGVATTSGTGGSGGALGTGGGFGTGGGGPVQSLTIQPQDPVLVYTGASLTQQFKALQSSTEVNATWTIDNDLIGSIDNGGLFTATGTAGGTAKVTASFAGVTASTTVTVKIAIQENPGNVSPGDQGTLKGSGAADPAFRFVYPYDKTVFPRGLAAPTMQFLGTAPTAMYVHIETANKGATYDGFFGASNPARIDISPNAWKALTNSAGPGQPLIVHVSKLVNGQVSGPIQETWSVAGASLKGTLYYNSYDSKLGGNIGAILKIKPGQQAQILVGGGGKCTVCHTVSANGNTMIASNDNYQTGAKYDLKNNASQSGNRNDYAFNFPAVYPDGSLVVSTSGRHIGGMWGSAPSKLYDVASGQMLSAPGWDGVVTYAGMPAFSPDGKHIAFNWEDQDDRHTLAMMDFDIATKSFSNLQTLYHDPVNQIGWPSFLPDGKSIVFDLNDGSGSPDYGTWNNNRAELAMVDTATKTVTKLGMINGFDNGQPYLPYGNDDERRNYEPTVLPVAVGGYYWVVFTSRRQYGNTINTVETGNYGDTKRKKLWIAAIDLDPQPGTDPSHPPIYMPGQELESGNMRGFWVLDPCKGDGQSCDSGDECCGGYCTLPDDGGAKVCNPVKMGCAQEFDKCTTAADCCKVADGYECINGHCAAPPPPK